MYLLIFLVEMVVFDVIGEKKVVLLLNFGEKVKNFRYKTGKTPVRHDDMKKGLSLQALLFDW